MKTRTRIPLVHSTLVRLVSMLLVAALIAPSLSPALDLDLWGWLPDHGHASLSGVAGAHSHPWDASATPESAPRPASQGIVFTAGDLAGAPAIPVMAVAALLIPAMTAVESFAGHAITPAAQRLAPESPPPR
ncbi:MAG: hypothetical protein WC273_03210 [Dehalococcoidia bacterium]